VLQKVWLTLQTVKRTQIKPAAGKVKF